MAMNTANGKGGLCYSWQPAKFANMVFCKYHYIHYYHFIKWIHQNDWRYMGREILLFLWSNQIPLYNFTRIIRTSRDVLLSDHKVWYIIGHFYNIFAHFCKWFLVTKRCFIERWSSLIYNWYDIFSEHFCIFLQMISGDQVSERARRRCTNAKSQMQFIPLKLEFIILS